MFYQWVPNNSLSVSLDVNQGIVLYICTFITIILTYSTVKVLVCVYGLEAEYFTIVLFWCAKVMCEEVVFIILVKLCIRRLLYYKSIRKLNPHLCAL